MRADQAIFAVTGFLLLAGGISHVGVWLHLGGSLEGPVSWRKPILFCFASGVTSISLAWLAGKLAATRWDIWLALVFGVALLGEVGLICILALELITNDSLQWTKRECWAFLTAGYNGDWTQSHCNCP